MFSRFVPLLLLFSVVSAFPQYTHKYTGKGSSACKSGGTVMGCWLLHKGVKRSQVGKISRNANSRPLYINTYKKDGETRVAGCSKTLLGLPHVELGCCDLDTATCTPLSQC
ncbi:hypothetical protein E4T56_gene18892 [Termitomyces sp. T112]|nr:hypothetical protein E4T56_gene18892 [Termitomyces sp. T112]